ncbi:MAG: MATE family efflux transporter [Lachnospiraceae bacterium]|nr:MATE family efflux transporter [Lachnospiraceae bacterium]
MLVQALYNVVDSVFVARVSEDALTAVTLAFPLQNLMIAVGSGTGVGVNALLSRALGERKFKRADKAANMALFLSFCNSILFLLVGLFISGAFIRSQTENAAIAGMGEAYLRIVNCFSLGLMFQMMFERLLQSTGRTVQSMASQLTGAIVNIILDPIMIFGWFGLPAMGVAGAAYATVIGQTTAAVIGLVLNVKTNTDVHFSLADIVTPEADIIRKIYLVGVPSILMMSIGSLMTYMMNRILIVFSTTATAVFGVYFKLQSFFFMPVFGLNNGLIPVLAYNYGARKKDRIYEALRFSFILAISIMLAGTLIFHLFPEELLGFFNASGDMLELGVPALRIISLNFPLAACGIVMGSIFQAFSRSMNSLVVSVCRQILVLIPAAWLLSKTGSVINVWWAFPISEIVSLVISVVLFRRLYDEIVRPM